MRFEPDTPLLSIDASGNRQHYLQAGTGAPVVLIHGSLCDCRYWKPQMAPLARRHRVLAPSLRHHWPGTGAPDQGDFSIRQHAEDIADFIDALGLGAVHLVGHSRGGRVALEVALRHRESVSSLTLADPGMTFDASAPAPLRAPYVAQAAALIGQGDVQAGLALFVDAVNGENTWARMIEGFRRMATDNASTLAGQSIEPLVPVDADALRHLTTPTLLIGGADSPPRYAAGMDRLAALLPDTRRLTIRGAAHGMNLAKPHSFNTAILEFLDSLSITERTA